MATWIVGDLHGCYDSFMALLERIAFDRDKDRICLVGDIVNRGPKSLECLRWVYDHRDIAQMVLGNHDMHLIARHLGAVDARKKDTLEDILNAADADGLVDWLCRQPFAIELEGHLVVHAGVHPEWTTALVFRRARALSETLAGEGREALIRASRSDRTPDADMRELLESLDVFTRIRTLDRATGALDHTYKATLSGMPRSLTPWFRERRGSRMPLPVVFGHWAAIGVYEEDHALAIDSGCVWGNNLSAFRVEDGVVVSQPAVEQSAD